jgi:hypothetical protein
LKQTGSYREAVGKLPGNYREGMSEQTSVALDANRHDPISDGSYREAVDLHI